MTTVALVGGDGAGKTTIARHLEKNLPCPGKYLYMGTSVLSGDAALPTTRLVRKLKMQGRKKDASASGDDRAGKSTVDELHYGSKKRGTIWVAARLLNRLAESWWRQLLCVSYQVRGYVVIFDRHFLFQAEDRHNSKVSFLFEHLEHWLLDHTYPRPDLVVFLDAPVEVLCRRKGDAAPDQLIEQRNIILEKGKRMPKFVVIDADRPLEQVVADVIRQIISLRAS